MMSNEILRSHEQQFGILCADITTKISKYSQYLSKENDLINKKPDIINVEQLFQEANELIEQMELEIRDISLKQNTAEQKQKYLNIIKSYKNELNKLEAEFKRRINVITTRSDLFLAEKNDVELERIQYNNEERLINMNKSLENGFKITLESEEIGKTILNDLNQQREVMQRSRERIRNMNDDLSSSSRVLSKMVTRLIQNKIILFSLFAFLFLIFTFIILFFSKQK